MKDSETICELYMPSYRMARFYEIKNNGAVIAHWRDGESSAFGYSEFKTAYKLVSGSVHAAESIRGIVK